MLRKSLVLITMAASLIAGAINARAQDAGALLDLLVKKRIITDQEAEDFLAFLHGHGIRLFYAQVPARFGVINPDRADPPAVSARED